MVCRFIESRWRCWCDQEGEDITREFPDDPFHDWKSPPPYVDYQFASIIISRILLPLRDEILRELEQMVEKHKPGDWYVTFLTSFILLQNYELQMQFQRDFAMRRNAQVSRTHLPREGRVDQALTRPSGPVSGHAASACDELGRKDYPGIFPLRL